MRPTERTHHAGELPRHRVRGGFSYAEVLESASVYAATILFNKELKAQFDAFYARPDTFSLALLDICNGCHWLPAEFRGRASRRPSSRASSRTRHLVNVRVKSNPILLQSMEGSTLGVWAIHNDAFFPKMP